MPQPRINFSNVNITIQQFQEISSGKSSPQDIFKATCRLHGIVSKACIDSKAGASFDEAGGVETIALNSFVTGLVFARLDEKTLTGIRDALYSKNGGTVQIAMDRLYEGRFPQGSNVDPQLRVSISTLAHTLGNTYLYDLAAVVNDALGIEAPRCRTAKRGSLTSTRSISSRSPPSWRTSPWTSRMQRRPHRPSSTRRKEPTGN